ncbi:thiamine biosynthesis protein ThiI [Salmonella enterica subsp. enterica]|nr:thiamine biosynthesis protein ThiI [Salmonella enterica subsp. enterica]
MRVKRRGKHEFSSIEVERYVGGGLNQHIESARVKLTNPDVTVHLEVEDDRLLLIKGRYEGIGGFPIGTQEDVLSLISGGFDSGVSSYMLMRRGCRVHYCFFNLGGAAHEIGVRQVAHYLWNRFGSSHRVRFVAINFEPVVGEILEKVDDGQMGVVLKRMMVRAASKVAERYGVQALVTGEALGQVSSQTLTNLRLIDNVSDTLILRPLISYDKEHIINLARQIGTEDFARTMPEYCGVISKSPTVKAIKAKIEAEEENFDFSILDKVVEEANNVDIREIAQQTQQEVVEVETVSGFGANDVILDIRSVDEQDDKPLKVEGVDVVSLPFYKLSTKFGDLDQSKTWLLWCERGVMSRLQALYLREQGFANVKVVSPVIPLPGGGYVLPGLPFYFCPNRFAMRSSFIISSSVMATSTMVSAAPSADISTVGQAKDSHRQRRPARRINHHRRANSPMESDKLSASADIIHGINNGNVHVTQTIPGDAPRLDATFSISAEIRASPVDTLLKVKAEISTKCAVSTIHRVPFICNGPWLKATRMPQAHGH